MKTYDNAPDEVQDKIEALMEAYHPKLIEAGVTIHALYARNGAGHAILCGGYPALAVVRVVGLKDRVKGMKDAEIVIDAERYEELSEGERDGLLDHELFHLETVSDPESGGIKKDDCGRPRLVLRKHDIQIGWFREISVRHGKNSPEQVQARALMEKDGQFFFPFIAQNPA